MQTYNDISTITNSSYKIAELINGGHYSNILYYEFHNYVEPDKIYYCLEGLEKFQNKSEKYYGIFMGHGFVDERPANIDIAVKISDEWFIAQNCGSNYYLGFGPQGILKLREACYTKKVSGFIFERNIKIWLKEKFISDNNKNVKFDNERIQFEELIKNIQYMSVDMQRKPLQFQGLNEENIRDYLLTSINGAFLGRGNAEAKNAHGKTDILVRTKDGTNENIFELKVWRGIKTLENAIKQLISYNSWHNKYAGLIIINYNKNLRLILNKVEKYLHENFVVDKRDINRENEFRFRFNQHTDKFKDVECWVNFINLCPTDKKI